MLATVAEPHISYFWAPKIEKTNGIENRPREICSKIIEHIRKYTFLGASWEHKMLNFGMQNRGEF